MFAISFDMLISDLKENYRDPYHNAYFEIASIMERYGFYRGQGSVYLSTVNDINNSG
jgi:virulence-associated protein VapD